MNFVLTCKKRRKKCTDCFCNRFYAPNSVLICIATTAHWHFKRLCASFQ